MGEPLISLHQIFKEYETGTELAVPVLHGIDLAIHSGEFVCLMGHSGSGKSTLMNILGCLDTPTSGDYAFEGRKVSLMSADELAVLRNQKIGFVFQGFNLLKRMSVIDNVALPMIYGGVARQEGLRRAREKLALVGLGSFEERLPNQLSGGQQQRVAIARALVMDPLMLLADEPTGNLDTATSGEIMDLVSRLNQEQGITILLVTHEPDIARYAKRLVRMKDGLIIYDGAVQEALA